MTALAQLGWELFRSQRTYSAMVDNYKQQVASATVVLCDEFLLEDNGYHTILEWLQPDQNCFLFTSDISCVELPQFETIHLKASLRSTGSISRFATRWREWCNAKEFDCHPAHNFEGEAVDIQIIPKTGRVPNRLLEYPHFTARCATLIKHTAEKLKDHEALPVICFMSDVASSTLLSTFRKLFPNIIIQEFIAKKIHRLVEHGPIVVLLSPGNVEGTEFGAVVVVVSYTHMSDFASLDDRLFLTAITRASTKLTIIVSDSQLMDCRELKDDPSEKCKECTDAGHNLKLQELFADYDAIEEKPFILLVGNKPSLVSFQQQKYDDSDLSSIGGVSEYVGAQGSFLHVEDVSEISSLETFRIFGIKCIVMGSENSSCDIQTTFYLYTYKLIEAFSKKTWELFQNIYRLIGPGRLFGGVIFTFKICYIGVQKRLNHQYRLHQEKKRFTEICH